MLNAQNSNLGLVQTDRHTGNTWRKTVATEWSACSGHGSNQSMTVLLTRPGKLRQRVRRVSPTGDIASTICRLLRHCSTNCSQQASLLSFVPCFTACNRPVDGWSILQNDELICSNHVQLCTRRVHKDLCGERM